MNIIHWTVFLKGKQNNKMINYSSVFTSILVQGCNHKSIKYTIYAQTTKDVTRKLQAIHTTKDCISSGKRVRVMYTPVNPTFI